MHAWGLAAICSIVTGCYAVAASGPDPSTATSGSDAGIGIDAGSADAAMPDAGAPSASRQLPIAPRNQWPNADGYCGEMSIQSAALYYGAWISEQVARSAAAGELLLGVNEQTALSVLHLDHVDWDSGSPEPQAGPFLAWVKTQLQHGMPVIYAVYLTDAFYDPAYDHIVPAVGITASTFGGYVSTDQLASNNNFDERTVTTLGSFAATRAGCARDSTHGGCIPRSVDYGVAISGITDVQHVTLPAMMIVAGSSEPNVSLGAPPSQMTATLTISGLTAGRSYAILRYDDYTKVPTDATAAQFLASPFTHLTTFVATCDSYTFVDPATFISSGATYYRVVAL